MVVVIHLYKIYCWWEKKLDNQQSEIKIRNAETISLTLYIHIYIYIYIVISHTNIHYMFVPVLNCSDKYCNLATLTNSQIRRKTQSVYSLASSQFSCRSLGQWAGKMTSSIHYSDTNISTLFTISNLLNCYIHRIIWNWNFSWIKD